MYILSMQHAYIYIYIVLRNYVCFITLISSNLAFFLGMHCPASSFQESRRSSKPQVACLSKTCKDWPLRELFQKSIATSKTCKLQKHPTDALRCEVYHLKCQAGVDPLGRFSCCMLQVLVQFCTIL